MELKKNYLPVKKELAGVNDLLRASLSGSKNASLAKINKFLLTIPGKRLRPAMVVLAAKISLIKNLKVKNLLKVAAALELIHTASLVHDDIIDQAGLRHHQPTVNRQWGEHLAIAGGDYLYTEAFSLFAQCGNFEVLGCVSRATKLMCEGQLQVVGRGDNLEQLKKEYLTMVKNKTAVLFAASCQAGAMMAGASKIRQEALAGYGLNFGLAFQIMDDCLDLTASQADLGKKPGADFRAQELTLPILNLLESVSPGQRKKINKLLALKDSPESFKRVRSMFFDSQAVLKTKAAVLSFIALAKKELSIFPGSTYKNSLFALADFIARRGFKKR